MLKNLTIKNWKAFEDKSFEFKEGINFIVGENGVGKTTVLEAICLAMSGDTTHSDFLSLVRDSQKTAQIELNFRLDSKEYKIIRQFSFKSKQKSELISEGERICHNWDPVSDRVMKLLDIESAFFRRLIYMSEGEIYKYLHDPPDHALNRRIQYIFGTNNLLATEEFLNKARISFTNQIKATREDLERLQIGPRKKIEDLKVLEVKVEELMQRKKAIENEKRKIDAKIFEIKESIPWFNKAKEIAEKLMNTIADNKELSEAKAKPLKGVILLKQEIDSSISHIERKLSETQKNIGKFENRKKYFEDIKNLLKSLEDEIRNQVSVPCPICKRPISKDMGKHLTKETNKGIRHTEKELSKLSREKGILETELGRQKGIRAVREECRIQLENMPENVLEQASEMSVSKMDEKIKILEDKISNYNGENKKIEETNSEIETKTNLLTQGISDIKAEQRNVLLKKELERKLVKAHKGEMLASISASAVKHILIDITNVNLKPIFIIVSDLLRNFRPERKWQLNPQLEAEMEIKDETKKYKYEDLSGGEKTVLLVLIRVAICKALSKVGFLMIDEPLEHLDIRNRRSLINYLSIVNEKKIIPQMIVTTFEETLLRKHFYDPKVKTVFLQ